MNRVVIVEGVMVDLMCDWCSRLSKEHAVICEAFPNGIPEVILSGSFDHRKPHDGDGGIRFEPKIL